MVMLLASMAGAGAPVVQACENSADYPGYTFNEVWDAIIDVIGDRDWEIDELEREERGIYSGSIGYLSFDGGMDLNIVIRTILCAEGSAHLRVGGGIVADSDPEAEYRETLDKAHALLRALNVRLGSA